MNMPISQVGRGRTLLQKKAVGPPLEPLRKYKMIEVPRRRRGTRPSGGRWKLMGNKRWIFTVLRYVTVTIIVLWLLTIKAC